MDEFSPCRLDPFFSFRQSDSGAYVVWKVRDFSTLTSNKYKSPEFNMEKVSWYLLLYPFGNDKDDLGNVSLFLKPASSINLKLKYRVFCKNEAGLDLHERKREKNFSDGTSHGFSKFLNRQDLLDGELGNLLPDDILTIYCEIKRVETSATQEETSTGAEENFLKLCKNCEKNSFLCKFHETFDSGRLSDIVLRVGEETIPAHKVILSTHSEVFRGMFASDMKENRENIVDLVDMNLTVAKAMLLYIYTQQVEELSTVKILELYIAADRYMLTELKEKCRSHISNNLTSKIVSEVFEVANMHSDNILSESAQKFFAHNARSILKSEEWEEFVIKKPSSSIKLLSFAIASNDFF